MVLRLAAYTAVGKRTLVYVIYNCYKIVSNIGGGSGVGQHYIRSPKVPAPVREKTVNHR